MDWDTKSKELEELETMEAIEIARIEASTFQIAERMERKPRGIANRGKPLTEAQKLKMKLAMRESRRKAKLQYIEDNPDSPEAIAFETGIPIKRTRDRKSVAVKRIVRKVEDTTEISDVEWLAYLEANPELKKEIEDKQEKLSHLSYLSVVEDVDSVEITEDEGEIIEEEYQQWLVEQQGKP